MWRAMGGGGRRSKNSTDRRRNYLNFDFKENETMLGNKFKKKKKIWNFEIQTTPVKSAAMSLKKININIF